MGCGNGLIYIYIYIYITGCKHFQNFQVPRFWKLTPYKEKIVVGS